jgi:hypothetical protein
MTSHDTFIARALAGEVLDPIAEAFAAIDEWHDASTDLDLPQWLGMTKEEYRLFAEKPESIRTILAAKKNNVDVFTLLQEGTRLAARGASPQELADLRQWLISTGRLR